jgi:hypothetical protein
MTYPQCSWYGDFSVVNTRDPKDFGPANPDRGIRVVALPGHQGTVGNGPHTIKAGESMKKKGVWATAKCDDSDIDVIQVTDWGGIRTRSYA